MAESINDVPYLATTDTSERTINEIPYLVKGVGGGGGSDNYNDLNNKPKINGVELKDDKSTSDLFTAGEGISIEGGTVGVDFNTVATNNYVNEKTENKEDKFIKPVGNVPTPEQTGELVYDSISNEWRIGRSEGKLTTVLQNPLPTPYTRITLLASSDTSRFDSKLVEYMVANNIPIEGTHVFAPTALRESEDYPTDENWLLDGQYPIANSSPFMTYSARFSSQLSDFNISFTISDGRTYHWEYLSLGPTIVSGHNASGVQMASAQMETCTASAQYSVAVGYNTQATQSYAHTEGMNSIASALAAHAEGNSTQAIQQYAHAEGTNTVASGYGSHAEGNNTVVSKNYAHVQGRHNVRDTAGTYAHIVGNGLSSSQLSNAHTLDWDGNSWYKGLIRVGGNNWDEGTPVVTGTGVAAIVALTQAEYDALATKDANTLYVIKGA